MYQKFTHTNFVCVKKSSRIENEKLFNCLLYFYIFFLASWMLQLRYENMYF